MLTQLELELRQYFDPRLGDFTNVAFKLCEGMYQVELTRCFHQHLLDLVVIGYMQEQPLAAGEQSLTAFAAHLNHPLVIVGPEQADHFLLNRAAEAWLREQAVEYLQVKTLGPSREDAGYARTRAFYIALNFRPLEELKQLWDEHNPCLIMVKRL